MFKCKIVCIVCEYGDDSSVGLKCMGLRNCRKGPRIKLRGKRRGGGVSAMSCSHLEPLDLVGTFVGGEEALGHQKLFFVR